MYTSINIKVIIKLLSSISIFIMIILMSITNNYSLENIFRAIGLSITLTLFIVSIIGETSLWRKIWRLFPSLNYKICPDINGVWRGTIDSNWPAIEKMINAARGDISSYDPLSSKLTQEYSEIKKVIMRIRVSWFRVNISLETEDNYSKSKILLSKIKFTEETNHYQLIYNYLNETINPLPSDIQNHYGSALLDIIWNESNEPKTLEGRYWTDRNWKKGINTAGTIKLKRISRTHKQEID